MAGILIKKQYDEAIAAGSDRESILQKLKSQWGNLFDSSGLPQPKVSVGGDTTVTDTGITGIGAVNTGANMTGISPAVQAQISALQAQLNAQQTQAQTQAAAAAAAETAKRESVGKIVAARFAQYGLSTLGAKVLELAKQGYNEDTITLELQNSEEYKIRFAHPYYGGITAQLSQSKGPFKITLYADDMTSPSRQNFANLQFRDRIYFRFYVADSYSTNWNDNTAKTTFDNSQFKVKFFDRNNKQIEANVNAQSITAVGYDEYVVCAFWDNKDRFSTSVFDYTQVYKVEITGYVSFAWVSTLGNTTPVSKHRNLPSFFDFKPCTIGGVNLSLQPPDRNNQNYINFGTVRYTPSSGEVSEVHNLSTLTSNDLINGTFLDNKYNSLPKTGSWLSVVFPTSGTSTTESWLVVNDNQSPSSWRKVGFATNPGTNVSGVGTATYYYNVNDLLSKPTVVPNRTYIQNATCVTTFNGWVVYGINAGINNVRHSRIGDPLILKSANDREGTKSNGADFTLSESYSDVPIAMAGILDTLVIWGQEGVYAQSGPYPTAMTSIKKIPNLPGIAGKFAFCKYVDPQLGNGVIYVSRTADRAFFLYVDASSLNVQYKNVELTESIRGTFKTYLTQTLTDISKIKVAYRQDIGCDEYCLHNQFCLKNPHKCNRDLIGLEQLQGCKHL